LKNKIEITIITATLNSGQQIRVLIDSLNNQSNKNFNWVVADGNSSDSTVAIIRNSYKNNLLIDQQSDFGIYDALNRAIKKISSDYYLVVGSDDVLNPNIIEKFYSIIDKSKPDFISFSWEVGNKIHNPSCNKGWLYGSHGVAGCHSVSLIIKKDLHYKYGYYSNLFPIYADHLFVKTCIYNGAIVFRCKDFVAGDYSGTGFSSENYLGNLLEFFRVQMVTENSLTLQIVIFLLKFFKNIIKITKQSKLIRFKNIPSSHISTKRKML
jgi:glycosyltransferase involved in cell wall biosynthesis